MKIEISSKIYLLLILIFSALIVWPLFLQGYFFHHDDLQVMRIFEMKRCFQDLQIPCRWVPDMGYGNGYPLFNYYPVLPYYIGGLLSFFLGLVNSAKALFFIPLILGGVFMFILSKRLFGKDIGFAVAILYLFAPYRALDSYVRGAVAESFAIALIPLVFYFFHRMIEKPQKISFILGSLTFACFLLSHNIMTMLFMPFILLWILISLLLNKWKHWKIVVCTFILGVGLASFFLLPVFLEKNLVQTETLISGGSNFRTHFVGIGQLFLDRSWGYGGSEFGPNDTISFQIGWPHWWFLALLIPLFIINFNKNKEESHMTVFFLSMFLISIFMAHNRSAFIWEVISNLQYTQFPWRFLSLSIFSVCILAGFTLKYMTGYLRTILILSTVISAILLNWNFFVPRDFYSWINDKTKLEEPLWEIQQKAGILDYLPKTASEPLGRAPVSPELIKGNVQTSDFKVSSNNFSFNAKVQSDSSIEVPIFDFPNWTVYVNDREISHNNKNTLGRIGFELQPGNYQITGIFKDTLVRTLANLLTLISITIVLIIWYNKKLLQKII